MISWLLRSQYFVLDLGEVVTIHLKNQQFQVIFSFTASLRLAWTIRRCHQRERHWEREDSGQRESGREERKGEGSENASHKPRSFLSKSGLFCLWLVCRIDMWFSLRVLLVPTGSVKVTTTGMLPCRMATSIPDITGPAHGDLHVPSSAFLSFHMALSLVVMFFLKSLKRIRPESNK